MAAYTNNERHYFPKTNEYQWRNLYLKQYGLCVYPPPMPSNPDILSSLRKKRQSPRRGLAENARDDSRSDDGDGDDSPSFDPSLLRHPRDPLLLPSPCRQERFGSIELLTDEQLFSPALFSFLGHSGDGERAAPSPKPPPGPPGGTRPPSPSKSISRLSMVLPSILRTEGKRSPVPSQNSPSPREIEEDDTGSVAGAAALARLRRETWMLLMDNRIMSWFEREAQKRGRIVAGVQRHLLEVVSWNPTKVEDTKKYAGRGNNLPSIESEKKKVPVAEAAVVSEDEQLMIMLERFAPFFAVISPPERLLCLAEHVVARQHGGSPGVAADAVGLPLLSQYATWREAYENRKAWRLAPFSFFLIYDCSYNYAHIAAIYVLVDLINKNSHTHAPDCILGERRRRVSRPETRSGRRSQRAKENPQCPLLELQQMTEDLFLAYEQSAARTTLPMALRVLDFLLDTIVDPDTAERFLSIDALRRQCSSVEALQPHEKASEPDKQSEISKKENRKESRLSREASTSEMRTEDGAPTPSIQSLNATAYQPKDMDSLDFSMIQRLDDASFEGLFVLANWIVDAPTANSLIPVDNTVPLDQMSSAARMHSDMDLRVSFHTSTRSKRNNMFSVTKKINAGTPSNASDSRRSQSSAAVSHVAGPRDSTYIVGRTQEFKATSSIVEAITRYEIQRRTLFEQRATEMRQRALAGAKGKKQRRRRFVNAAQGFSMTDDFSRSPNMPMADLSTGVTLLSTPLIFMTTYIRLHGALWLKELLGRFFNILRRESVLLYVNSLELEKPSQPVHSQRSSASLMSFSGERGSSPSSPDFTGHFFRWQHLSEGEQQYYQRLERLEDLVCQDIQYVTEEFFSALHGKRSMTRLPQDISVLLTSLCTTVHLHLLSQHATLDMSFDKPAIRVRRCLDELRQRRVMSTGQELWGPRSHDPLDRLLRSIEHHRLAKFILFDCWILPAMNNAVEFGFLPESSSNHLRWNVDAFARYLKILVNAPFFSSDGVDPYIYTTTVNDTIRQEASAHSPARSPAAHSSYPDRKQRQQPQQQDSINLQRCHTVKIPPFINGIYDVSSGNLMQVFQCPGNEEDDMFQGRKFTFGDTPTNEMQNTGSSFKVPFSVTSHDQSVSCSSLEHGRKPHADLSGALSTLNESLGITGGGDEGEAYEDDTDVTPARILNIFCARTASDISAKVVTTEFVVAPSTAARCVDKMFSLMSGEHEMVRNATLSGSLIGFFKSSPYLTCLMGVLQHPHTASTTLENAYQNNRKFYNALMKPLQDNTLLTMLSTLLGQKRVPMVDSNELISTIAAIPMTASDSENSGERRPPEISAWELLTRHLIKRRTIAASGASLPPESIIFPLLRRCGPTSPKELLDATVDAIRRDMGNVPLCFDTWWHAMSVALTTKAMNVLDESNEKHSAQWEEWCGVQMHEAQREYRGVCRYFIESKGEVLDIVKDKASSLLKENRGTKQSTTISSSLSRTQAGSSTKSKKKRRREGVGLKSRKSEKDKKL